MDLSQAASTGWKGFSRSAMLFGTAAVLSALPFAAPALASDDETPMHFSIVAAGKNCPGCVVINAAGQIVDETSRSFSTFLSQNRLNGVLPPEPSDGQPPANSPKVIVAFESIGGKVQAALIMGRRIRKAGWTTVIGQAHLSAGKPTFESAGCYSACTMVMLGGVNRFVVPLSKVGVHQFSPQFNDGETFDAQEMNQIVRDYGREVVSMYDFVHAMDVPEAFFTTTLRTPFSSLDVLPQDQWVATGVATALMPDTDGPVPASAILDAMSPNDLTSSIAKPSVGLKAPEPSTRASFPQGWTVIRKDGAPAAAEFANPEYRIALACRDDRTAKLDLAFKELSPSDIEKLRDAAFSAKALMIAGHDVSIDNVAASGDGEQSIAASLAVKDVKEFPSSGILTFAVLDKAGAPVGPAGSIPTAGVAEAISDAMSACGA